MTTPSETHEHIRDLLGVYATNIADQIEQRLVERHVARCTACHSELQSLISTTDALALAPEQQQLPAHVIANVMSVIGDVDHSAVDAPAAERRTPTNLFRRLNASNSLRFALPAVACVALLTGVVGIQTARLNNQDHQLQELRAASDATQTKETSMVGTSHVMNVVTSGALDRSTVELVDIHGAGLLITKNLPDPPDGHEWRVWGVDKTHEMHPMGGLNIGAEREMGLQPITGIHDLPFEAVAITLEPSGAITQQGPVVGWAEMA